LDFLAFQTICALKTSCAEMRHRCCGYLLSNRHLEVQAVDIAVMYFKAERLEMWKSFIGQNNMPLMSENMTKNQKYEVALYGECTGFGTAQIQENGDIEIDLEVQRKNGPFEIVFDTAASDKRIYSKEKRERMRNDGWFQCTDRRVSALLPRAFEVNWQVCIVEMDSTLEQVLMAIRDIWVPLHTKISKASPLEAAFYVHTNLNEWNQIVTEEISVHQGVVNNLFDEWHQVVDVQQYDTRTPQGCALMNADQFDEIRHAMDLTKELILAGLWKRSIWSLKHLSSCFIHLLEIREGLKAFGEQISELANALQVTMKRYHNRQQVSMLKSQRNTWWLTQ